MKKRKKAPKVPAGAIVGETVKDTQAHVILRFDRPGRVEISANSKGWLVVHCYDGVKTDIDQEPIGGFAFGSDENLEERWVSDGVGETAQVDHEWNGVV